MTVDHLDYEGCAAPVEGLGPGKRLIIWVRGCARRCPGCLAPDTWESGAPTPVAEVAAVLHPLLTGMDGLTISGGEPFDQAGALCTLLATLRQSDDIEVLVYTGYRLEELQAGTPDQRALLAQIDLLIDGPFRQELPNTRQWRGSDNQRLHLLSARAQSYRAQDSVPMPDARPLQVQMLGPTRYRIIGIPRRGDLERYQALLAARGIQVRAASEESSDADSRRRPE